MHCLPYIDLYLICIMMARPHRFGNLMHGEGVILAAALFGAWHQVLSCILSSIHSGPSAVFQLLGRFHHMTVDHAAKQEGGNGQHDSRLS